MPNGRLTRTVLELTWYEETVEAPLVSSTMRWRYGLSATWARGTLPSRSSSTFSSARVKWAPPGSRGPISTPNRSDSSCSRAIAASTDSQEPIVERVPCAPGWDSRAPCGKCCGTYSSQSSVEGSKSVTAGAWAKSVNCGDPPASRMMRSISDSMAPEDGAWFSGRSAIRPMATSGFSFSSPAFRSLS